MTEERLEQIRSDFNETRNAQAVQDQAVKDLRAQIKKVAARLKDAKANGAPISEITELATELAKHRSQLRYERANLQIAKGKAEMAKVIAVDAGIATPRGMPIAPAAEDSEEVKTVKAEIETLNGQIDEQKKLVKKARKEYTETKEKLAAALNDELLSLSKLKDAQIAARNKLADLDDKYKHVLTREERKERRKKRQENQATGGRRGRASKFAGKLLKVSDDWANRQETPCRSGTSAEKSFKLIQDATHGHIKYEDFVESGGLARDVSFQVKKGNVIAFDPDTGENDNTGNTDTTGE